MKWFNLIGGIFLIAYATLDYLQNTFLDSSELAQRTVASFWGIAIVGIYLILSRKKAIIWDAVLFALALGVPLVNVEMPSPWGLKSVAFAYPSAVLASSVVLVAAASFYKTKNFSYGFALLLLYFAFSSWGNFFLIPLFGSRIGLLLLQVLMVVAGIFLFIRPIKSNVLNYGNQQDN